MLQTYLIFTTNFGSFLGIIPPYTGISLNRTKQKRKNSIGLDAD